VLAKKLTAALLQEQKPLMQEVDDRTLELDDFGHEQSVTFLQALGLADVFIISEEGAKKLSNSYTVLPGALFALRACSSKSLPVYNTGALAGDLAGLLGGERANYMAN
jgi:hypothetical protein